ncbi:MAG: hypothetical protein BWY81_00050 [Firmicutes bacterium ADurb.Bin467]|nr:MAG: hypothetical protein BWY81_00050 [Firmicutes bacterium ADurb.Bin467]
MNKRSILVALAMTPGSAPRRSNSAIANTRSSVPIDTYCRSAASGVLSNFGMCTWHTPISSERTAFNRLSSIVRPTDMTSPVAFICVDSLFDAVANLSNGKRAIFVTT